MISEHEQYRCRVVVTEVIDDSSQVGGRLVGFSDIGFCKFLPVIQIVVSEAICSVAGPVDVGDYELGSVSPDGGQFPHQEIAPGHVFQSVPECIWYPTVTPEGPLPYVVVQ